MEHHGFDDWAMDIESGGHTEGFLLSPKSHDEPAPIDVYLPLPCSYSAGLELCQQPLHAHFGTFHISTSPDTVEALKSSVRIAESIITNCIMNLGWQAGSRVSKTSTSWAHLPGACAIRSNSGIVFNMLLLREGSSGIGDTDFTAS